MVVRWFALGRRSRIGGRAVLLRGPIFNRLFRAARQDTRVARPTLFYLNRTILPQREMGNRNWFCVCEIGVRGGRPYHARVLLRGPIFNRLFRAARQRRPTMFLGIRTFLMRRQFPTVEGFGFGGGLFRHAQIN